VQRESAAWSAARSAAAVQLRDAARSAARSAAWSAAESPARSAARVQRECSEDAQAKKYYHYKKLKTIKIKVKKIIN